MGVSVLMEEGEMSLDAHNVIAQLQSMILPISCLSAMLSALVYLQEVKSVEETSSNSMSAEDIGFVLLIVISAASLISYGFALLYLLKYDFVMHWLVFIMMGIPSAWLTWIIANHSILLSYNVGCLTAWSILYREEHRMDAFANCGILIAASALAWPASYIAQETRVWLSLAVLSFWDIFAVSIGPFALIQREQQRRRWMAESSELTSGLVFRSVSGYTLGSGDLVLYAILILRSSLRRSFLVVSATIVGLLTGHLLTVVWSIRKRENNRHLNSNSSGNAVPALPAALGLGFLLYAASLNLILPYTKTLNKFGAFMYLYIYIKRLKILFGSSAGIIIIHSVLCCYFE